MRRFLTPTVIYLVLAMLDVVFSNSPVPGHALSLAILALAFLAPALVAAHTRSRLGRLLVCALFAVAAMLLWDAFAHLVLVKAEPFFILRGYPTLYLIGFAGLVFASYVAAWLGAPPKKSFKPTPLRGAA